MDNGTYEFRFYLTPNDIMEVARVPEDFRVLTVLWHEERQAFCFLAEAPHKPEFFVPKYEVLPIHAPAVTKVRDDKGDHLSIRFPQFEEEDAPKRRTGRKEG